MKRKSRYLRITNIDRFSARMLVLCSPLLLSACFYESSETKQAQHASSGMGQLLDGNTQGYSPVLPGKQLSFPAKSGGI